MPIYTNLAQILFNILKSKQVIDLGIGGIVFYGKNCSNIKECGVIVKEGSVRMWDEEGTIKNIGHGKIVAICDPGLQDPDYEMQFSRSCKNNE